MTNREKILHNLCELQKQSNRQLNRSTIIGIQDKRTPRTLVKHQYVHATKLATKPKKGTESLLDPKKHAIAA
jgi:hypothetical protein